MTTPNSNTFAAELDARRHSLALDAQQQRMKQLVRLIDELSGEMGSLAFVEAVREQGYDIDACAATIQRRQTQH